MEHDVREIGSHFNIEGNFISAVPYGSGHINDTYAAVYKKGSEEARYIFQRINHNIFKDPVKLMENISRVIDHQHEKYAHLADASRRALTLINAEDEKPYFQDSAGNTWRVYAMITDAKTYDVLETKEQAFQGAKAFAEFQKILTDLKGDRLHETIPNFHNTPKRFDTLMKVIENDPQNRVKDAKDEIDFIIARKDMVSVLLKLNEEGKIPERITHNDTKLNNVLIDNATGEGICVIDLDTVMPGLALYDFGDMVRTGTSPVEEDEPDASKVFMQMEMFEALAGGYLSVAKDFLTETEIEYLPFSGKLITLEIGIRFLTDFLEGDVYFKTSRENHNLDRCRTQIALVKSIEEQEEEMKAFVKKISG